RCCRPSSETWAAWRSESRLLNLCYWIALSRLAARCRRAAPTEWAKASPRPPPSRAASACGRWTSSSDRCKPDYTARKAVECASFHNTVMQRAHRRPPPPDLTPHLTPDLTPALVLRNWPAHETTCVPTPVIGAGR